MKAEEGNIISVLEAEIRLVKLLMNEKMQEVMKKKLKLFQISLFGKCQQFLNKKI